MPTLANVTGQAVKRLEMLYELPVQLAEEEELSSLFPLILSRLLELIPGAVRGALLLLERKSGDFLLRASIPDDAPPSSHTLILRATTAQEGFIWGDQAGDQQALSSSIAASGFRTGMYAPLLWKGDCIGVLFVDNPRRHQPFTQEDLRFLLSVAHYAASAVANKLLQDEIAQNNQTLQNLLTNFSPKIRRELLRKSREGRLQPGGEKSIVTILLSDLRGFTKTSASLDAQVVVDMLNDYFEVLGQEIFAHDGTIDKFIGDAILAVFGSPEAASRLPPGRFPPNTREFCPGTCRDKGRTRSVGIPGTLTTQKRRPTTSSPCRTTPVRRSALALPAQTARPAPPHRTLFQTLTATALG